jgi:hypothetical protein
MNPCFHTFLSPFLLLFKTCYLGGTLLFEFAKYMNKSITFHILDVGSNL